MPVELKHDEPSAPPPKTMSGSARISNLAVHLLREYTGRGPTKAKTTIGDDVVTVVLADTLTKGERTLANHGEEERVLDLRRTYQEAMQQEFTAGVEEILNRKVVAFMSANHVAPDMACEVFVLEPLTEEELAARRVGVRPEGEPAAVSI